MASLNPWWFIVVGAVVFIVSRFIVSGLDAFVYVSYGFLGYGLLRLAMQKYMHPKEKKAQASHQMQPGHTVHVNNMQQAPAYQQRNQHIPQQAIFCRKCGKKHAMHDNFCSQCGMRLR